MPVSAKLQSSNTFVKWHTLGNTVDADNKPVYTQRLVITGEKGFDRLAFNNFVHKMTTVNPLDKVVEVVPGYYYIESPRFHESSDSDTIVVDIVTAGSLTNICFVPEGFHVVMPDGSTRPVNYSVSDIIADPKLWKSPFGGDVMPYGKDVYDANAKLLDEAQSVGFYDIVPSFKNVAVTGGVSATIDKIEFIEEERQGKPEWFKAIINDNVLTIHTAADNKTAVLQRLEALNLKNTTNIPNAIIEDWPDFSYRGVMIDIARNYQSPVQMEKILRLMSMYGLNVLHFHFADDEAWRLEIPGMPELTEVGGRRGYTIDESDYLVQLFTGDGSTTSVNSSNGYFTPSDFVRMLKVADSLNIKVIPEIESPGHARAAIKAMEKRLRDTGDDTYRLIDPADTSVYSSAQYFHDDVMNPAIPGPVRFMTYVVGEIQKMYQMAGVEMPAIHIGGDEVAMGAWKGSPIAQAYMAERGMTNERDLHLIFIRELVENFTKMGIPVSGWQEIAVGHNDDFNAAVRPYVYSVNCWSTLGNQSLVTVQSARAGYPTVLSNVNHFYLDMRYTPHPCERGLNWGGYVNEYDALHGYAADLCNVEPEYANNVIGVSGHLFSETIRSGSMLESFLLPKMLGLAERGWNSTPTYSDGQFNAVINAHHLPVWRELGYTYHVAQPGIKVVDNQVVMNTTYAGVPGVEIHYTLDGSEPDITSPLYVGPIDASTGQVRAKAFIDGIGSVTSILYFE